LLAYIQEIIKKKIRATLYRTVICRIINGKGVEKWQANEHLRLLRQLGSWLKALQTTR